jgi:hypothetical protein
MHKKSPFAPVVEVLDEELALCSDVINQCFPDRKQPRLVSFGQPGGVPWTITVDEKNQLLKKYNLVERPPFFGYPFHVRVPQQWKSFSVTQGKDKLVSQLSDGMLRFAASPVNGEITARKIK